MEVAAITSEGQIGWVVSAAMLQCDNVLNMERCIHGFLR